MPLTRLLSPLTLYSQWCSSVLCGIQITINMENGCCVLVSSDVGKGCMSLRCGPDIAQEELAGVIWRKQPSVLPLMSTPPAGQPSSRSLWAASVGVLAEVGSWLRVSSYGSTVHSFCT